MDLAPHAASVVDTVVALSIMAILGGIIRIVLSIERMRSVIDNLDKLVDMHEDMVHDHETRIAYIEGSTAKASR